MAALGELQAKCPGCAEHIALQGAAPCGQNWTTVASPYWPSYAADWARIASRCPPVTTRFTPGASRLSGFAAERKDWTVDNFLEHKQLQPSKKRSVSITSMRVCAGVQPPGRAVPCLMPEGMGPESHLAIALQLVHPMARPISIPYQCRVAMAVQDREGENLERYRFQALEMLEALAEALWPESEAMATLIHPWIRKVFTARHIALFGN